MMTADAEENEIFIQRPHYTRQKFHAKYKIPVEDKGSIDFDTLKTRTKGFLAEKWREPCSSAKSFLLGLFPIFEWLPKYRVKEWLGSDVISGVTIGIMQIPQGMSYSLLAGQHPIYGLYNAFFAAILYSILGTSRHISMGTFAITSLMLGTAVSSVVPEPTSLNETSHEVSTIMDAFYQERIVLGASTTFVIGIFLLGLSFVNLGSVVTYLSEPMISGFTCGAAVHVFVSQLKGLFGVKVRSYSGPLNVIWVIRDIIIALTSLDDVGRTRTAATVVISVICIVFLLIVKEINERYKKKLPLGIPIPGEIFVVILGTAISYAVGFEELYHVIIVGDIPSGLPVPSSSAVAKIPDVVGYAIPIGVVGYSVAVSIAKIFANNFGYKIRPNQELVAYGCSNLVVSFFYCIPAFPSMSRSCVQVDSGGKTQLVGLISATLILLVLLWIGPLFRTIPRACLAAIIAVAIKGMLRKARDFKPYWNISKLDGAVWLVSCLATVFLDVVYGLVTGVGFSMLCVVFRTQFVQKHVLTQVDATEIFHKQSKHLETHQESCVVVAFCGPLHYVNKDQLGRFLIKVTGIDPSLEKQKVRKSGNGEIKLEMNEVHRNRSEQLHAYDNPQHESDITETELELPDETHKEVNIQNRQPDNRRRCVIVDCGQIGFMDSVGLKTLKKCVDEFDQANVKIVLANVTGQVMKILNRGGFVEKFGHAIVFLTVLDAITWWQNLSKIATNEDLLSDRL